MNSLKEKLEQRIPVFGTFNTLSHTSITNLISSSGLDFQILDLEHGALNFSTVADHVNACKSSKSTLNHTCSLLVRDSVVSRYSILQCLDQGSDGLVIPHVKSIKDISRLIDYIYYPPLGQRSFSPYTNAGSFGIIPPQTFAQTQAQDHFLVIIIESEDGICNLPSILECHSAHIDAVYFGAYDLSADMGYIGNPKHPNVHTKIMRALDICNKYNVAAGAYVPKTFSEAQDLVGLGFKFIAYQVDSNILASSYLEFMKSVQSNYRL